MKHEHIAHGIAQTLRRTVQDVALQNLNENHFIYKIFVLWKYENVSVDLLITLFNKLFQISIATKYSTIVIDIICLLWRDMSIHI